MVVLVLLLTAGMSFGQMRLPQLQNPIAWGWSPPPDSGTGQTNTSQNGTANGSSQTLGIPSGQNAAGSSSQNTDASGAQATGDSSSQSQASDGTAETLSPQTTFNTPSSADLQSELGAPVSTSASGSILQTLRSPFQIQPQGLKLGPAYLTSISDSFFYVVNTVPGEPTQTYTGDSLSATIIYNKQLSNGTLNIQGREQLSMSELTPYFNQSVTAGYVDQLSERWSVGVSAQFTYFQNSILANPEYLLVPGNNGPVLQTLFVLQRRSSMFESNSVDFTYSLSGRTHVTLSPILGLTFLEQAGIGWTSSSQFGGGVGVSRDITDNLTIGGNYTAAHTAASHISGAPGWNSQSLGMSFQYRFHDTWLVSGALAASGQLLAQVWQLAPTGNLRLMKSFPDRSSIFAAYTRSEASAVFASYGYYDQADLGYNRRMGNKTNLSFNVGEYRTVNALAREDGKHAGLSLSYRLNPHLSLNGGYNYVHQAGDQASSISPFLGTVNSFSFGVTWTLGSPASGL
jgi:hypothetical protein